MSPLHGASERAVILAPLGRDSQIALKILNEAGFSGVVAKDLQGLCEEIDQGAGMAMIASEALADIDMTPLHLLLSQQPAWSDLPIVLMTRRDGPDQAPSSRLGAHLGNVTFVERPFHPVTLVSLVTTAIRGRRRQYDARDRLRDLSESEQRLQNALTAGRLGAWQLDAQTLELDCSPITKGHYGRGALEPMSYADWLHSIQLDDQPRMQDSLQQSLQQGADFVLQCRTTWPDGSLHWVDLRARAIRRLNGEVMTLVGVSTDITERMHGEAQLRQLNETLEQQVEERTVQIRENEEALRQAQKMEAVGQLTGGIAHDFNNMLTGIIGSLELMRRRISRGRYDDLGGLIDLGVTSANRAAGLTHRLLAFSRRQSLDSQPVQMNRLVTAMDQLLQRSLNESIELEVNLSPDLWIAEADPHQLESALLNLVINARDAMPSGGQLRVHTGNQTLSPAFVANHANLTAGDYVVLSVSDNGSGMPQSVINRAFDPFFTTKPIGQGTGLGLSMIYGFSKQSRGHVAIESEIGKGTVVRLYLPRCQEEIDEAPTETSCTAPVARHGETVLIVEDDPAVRELVCAVLGELGYRYLEAADANSALPLLESSQRIDLMISDVGLPGMNGRQLAEVGRHRRPGLKILFITGYAEHASVRHGFLDPGMQMITKPFAFELLTTKVREMIET